MYTGRRGRLYQRWATIALNDLLGESRPLIQYMRLSITVGQRSEDAVGDGVGTKRWDEQVGQTGMSKLI